MYCQSSFMDEALKGPRLLPEWWDWCSGPGHLVWSPAVSCWPYPTEKGFSSR